jgi:Tol biopolymer transport system component
MKCYLSISIVVILLVIGCQKNPVELFQDIVKEKILKTSDVIFFSSDRDGKAKNIYMMTIGGDSVRQVTKYNWGEYAATAISPDSNQLLFYQAVPGLDIDVGMYIYLYKIKEDTTIGPITQGNSGNFTPDGKKIVLSRSNSENNGFGSVYLYDLTSHTEQKLTANGSDCLYPQLSPDGKIICYESAKYWDRDSMDCWQLNLIDIKGNYIGALTTLSHAYYAGNPAFSRDGKSVLCRYNEMTFCFDICQIDIQSKKINYITRNRYSGNYSCPNYYNPFMDGSGQKIYFHSRSYDSHLNYVTEILSVHTDGTQLKQITYNNFWDSHPIVGTVSFYIEK